ncbi:MAG: hypothetical protein R2754_17060 [Microthrixaceae bacterium]
MVLDEWFGESELGVAGGDELGPPVGLFGGADRWCGPPEGVLDEPEGVFDVEAAEVGAGCKADVDGVGACRPEPQGVAVVGAGVFGEVVDVDADDGAGDDGGLVEVGPACSFASRDFGVEAVPCVDGDGAVAVVVGGVGAVRFGPGVGVCAFVAVRCF